MKLKDLYMVSDMLTSPKVRFRSCRRQKKINIFILSIFTEPSNEVSQLLYYLFYPSFYFWVEITQNHKVSHSNSHLLKHWSFLNHSGAHFFHEDKTSLMQHLCRYHIFSLKLAFLLSYVNNRISCLLIKTMWSWCTNYRKYTFLSQLIILPI